MAKLKTETNTPMIEKRVVHAARAILHVGTAYLQADFEHGQWWITNLNTGAQYSVVDAIGGNAVDGFSLEQVTQGDSE